MKNNKVELAVFDLAGTVVDYGCRAPSEALRELFRRHGIDIADADVKTPLGNQKREQIASVLSPPAVSGQWRTIQGRDWTKGDVDRLLDKFLLLQIEMLPGNSDIIPGAVEALNHLRINGVKMAAITSYNSSMTALLVQKLMRKGIEFDYFCCDAEVATGSPRPWLILRCMEALDIFPSSRVISVGDSIADIQAGVNAGVWGVGVCKTGAMLGLSREQAESLAEEDMAVALEIASGAMREAGADMVIDSVAKLPHVLDTLNRELELGRIPGTLLRALVGASPHLYTCCGRDIQLGGECRRMSGKAQ